MNSHTENLHDFIRETNENEIEQLRRINCSISDVFSNS